MASVKMNNMNTFQIRGLTHFKSPVMFENHRFICSSNLQIQRSHLEGVILTCANVFTD